MNDLQESIEEGYRQLAVAIVAEAIFDKAGLTPKSLASEKELYYVDHFLKSNWCYNLCGLDYDYLVRLANKKKAEVEGRKKKR